MIVPVAQVLSETNDAYFLCYWLRDWLKSGARIPKEVITDMGKAIQQSVCMAFNTITFWQYNDECLSILLGNKSQLKLQTQLRTDVAHLEHTATKWLIKCNQPTKVKEFYRRAVGFMTTIDNIDHFTEYLKFVFVVSNILMHDNRCQEALTFIVKRIKTFKFDKITIEKVKDIRINKEIDNSECEDSSDKHTFIYKFIENIKESALSNNASNSQIDFETQNNIYHLPDYSNSLTALCREFPCWTNVMNEHFKNPHIVASSARSEGYFSGFKDDQLENGIPVKSDKLLIKTCRTIEKDIILSRAAVNDVINKSKSTFTKKCNEKDKKDHLLVAERWKHKFTIIESEQSSDESEIEAKEDENKYCSNDVDTKTKELNHHTVENCELPIDTYIENLNSTLSLKITLNDNDSITVMNNSNEDQFSDFMNSIKCNSSEVVDSCKNDQNNVNEPVDIASKVSITDDQNNCELPNFPNESDVNAHQDNACQPTYVVTDKGDYSDYQNKCESVDRISNEVGLNNDQNSHSVMIISNDHSYVKSNRGIYVSADPEFSLRQQKPANSIKSSGKVVL